MGVPLSCSRESRAIEVATNIYVPHQAISQVGADQSTHIPNLATTDQNDSSHKPDLTSSIKLAQPVPSQQAAAPQAATHNPNLATTKQNDSEHSSHKPDLTSSIKPVQPVTSQQAAAPKAATHDPNSATTDQNETEHSSNKVDVNSTEQLNPAIAQQAFKVQRPRLMIAISSSPPLVNELYSADVISESVRNKLSVIGISKDENNMILLNAVEDQIKTDPSAFMSFVSALKSEPTLEEMARQLLHSYRQMMVAVNQGTTTTCCGPIACYANYLKAFYDTSPISQAYKWPLTPSTQYINLAIINSEYVSREQADEFTRLTLHGDIDQVLHRKEHIKITDILKPKHGEKLRFVLVEGAPGVGKSTLAWELCRRWDEMETLKQYSLVVLLKLRDEGIQNATSLADFFYHADTDLQKAVFKEVKAREGEGVLLIMDGADECPPSFWRSDRLLIHRILSGHLLPKANVLVTTRPSASSILNRQWKPQKRIEVLGFTSDQISQYTEHILGTEPELLEGFHKYISSSPSIRGLLYIPLNTAIAVGVYRENRKKNKPIPTTLTQLYTDLILTLLQRYLLDSKLVENASALPQTIHNLPESIHQQFLDLAKVAYKGTIGQQFVFQKLPEGSKPLGLTTASAELHTGVRLSYNFLHLTLQEYLAAFYFSKLPAAQQQHTFLKHCSTSHLSVMWTFVAGLTHFKDVGLETVRLKMLEKYSCMVEIKSSLLPLLYEMQKEEYIQAVLGSVVVSYTNGKLNVAPPFHYYSLGYCIAHSKCTWSLIMCLPSSEHVEMFFLGVESQSQASSCICNLRFRDSELQKSIQYLRTLPLSGTQNLGLSNCDLYGKPLQILAHIIIPGMDSLKSLDISYNPAGSGEIAELLQMIKSLHTLNLRGLTLDCDDIKALAPLVVPQDGSLRELIIGSSKMETVTIQKMLIMLFAESSLQSLSLDSIHLQLSTDHLAELLEKNPNLKTLGLFHCGTLTTVCAKVLFKNTILETFYVSRDIGKDCVAVLSKVLRVNQSLKNLNISAFSRQPIQEKHVEVLIDALPYNQTLEKMTLPWQLQKSVIVTDPRIVFR